MNLKYNSWIFLFFGLWTIACTKQVEFPEKKKLTLFTEIPGDSTGISFRNDLHFEQNFNIYTYRNFYNGGGVAAGDINNDGLTDLYFSSNMAENKLYLNKGNFKFEDITNKAGVKGKPSWATGVTMADVNSDGWLDIYVCYSGDRPGDDRRNELYINNKNNTFTESASKYGLDDPGLGTHAAFFDYDKDGDLDCYLLNNSFQAISSFRQTSAEIRSKRDKNGGDKLFRNEGNHFIDVSDKAGIYGSVIGFGLGVTVGDIDLDGWQDIYVSNDFFERDYLYLNNGNGTFREVLTQQMPSISAASMGADMADLNNDAYPEVFVTEMLPAEDHEIKQKTTFENWDIHTENAEKGYHYQFTRNMLQRNNGDGTFSEVGRLAGVEATDWSWGALLFDMDLDGNKDLFIANGIYQDLTDQDYLVFISDESTKQSVIQGGSVNYKTLIDSIPSRPVPNYAFQNLGNFNFANKSMDWGLDRKGFSNGAVYADLDNDGDADLIVNNLNDLASIYRNESVQQAAPNAHLKFVLKGFPGNTYAFGTKILAKSKDQQFYYECMPVRGFQSSVDPNPILGLGQISVLDSLYILWPDGKWSIQAGVKTNQTLTVDYSKAQPVVNLHFKHLIQLPQDKIAPVFLKETQIFFPGFFHQENNFIDFDRDRLLPMMISTLGPRVAQGDINGDGRLDAYICGASTFSGQIWVQQQNGQFSLTAQPDIDLHKNCEDTDAHFFDADQDGDLDLYVASGGNEFFVNSGPLQDRLYLNDGKGRFMYVPVPIPSPVAESSSCVTTADFDKDGDQDLFVGIRMVPHAYGKSGKGYLLQNDGTGNFLPITELLAPELLQNIGMITDAAWADLDGDQYPELVLCGDFMGIEIFKNSKGRLQKLPAANGTASYKGWWNRIHIEDMDGDGDLDIIGANHGLNARFKASDAAPMMVHMNDFDDNQDPESIFSRSINGKQIPYIRRNELVMQMPTLKKKFLHFHEYAHQSLNGIFPGAKLSQADSAVATYLSTALFVNQGQLKFKAQALPMEAQLTPIYAITVADVNKDGIKDLLLGGNLYGVKPEFGRYDASYGVVLIGQKNTTYQSLLPRQSGIQLAGEIRDFLWLDNKLLVFANKQPVQCYRLRQ